MSGKSVRPKKFPTFSIDDLLEESGKQSAHKVGDSYTSSLSSELLNSPGGEQAVRQIISFINPKDVRNLSRVDQHLSQACSDEVKHLKKKLRSDFNKFYRKINTSENNLAPTTTLEENADRLIALLKRTHEFYYFYDVFPLNKEIIRMLEEAYGNIYGDLWSESSNMLNKLLQIEHEEHSEQQGNYFDAITLSAQLSIKTEKINSLYELLTKINDYWYEKQKKIKISPIIENRTISWKVPDMDEETTLPAGFSYCQLKNIKFKDIRLYYKNSDSGLRHTKFINCISLGNVFAEPDILAKVETSNETEHHPNPWKFNVYDKFRNTDSYIFHPPENIEQLKKQNKKPIKKISRIQKKDSAKQEENQYSFFSFHQREEEKKRAQANSDEELATTLMRLEFL